MDRTFVHICTHFMHAHSTASWNCQVCFTNVSISHNTQYNIDYNIAYRLKQGMYIHAPEAGNSHPFVDLSLSSQVGQHCLLESPKLVVSEGKISSSQIMGFHALYSPL